MIDLPSPLQSSEWAARLNTTQQAIESVGAALMVLRTQNVCGREVSFGQLKTSVDQAAEGWVLGYLRAVYPSDHFLCEELYEQSEQNWAFGSTYWTVDALDGTRSFVEGFEGFCVQVGYVENGRVQFGVIYEPVRKITYWAAIGRGAYRTDADGTHTRLRLQPLREWPRSPVFVDSTRPAGTVGELLRQVAGRFLECGSIGLKICKVAEHSANIFVKTLTFKLWDVAPGDLIVSEAGGKLGVWSGSRVPYTGNQVYFNNLLVAPCGLFELVAVALSSTDRMNHLN